jgi:hypothetical protein
MQFYECDRHAAKNLALKHLHGGKVRKWSTDFNISDDVHVRAKVVRTDNHRMATEKGHVIGAVTGYVTCQTPILFRSTDNGTRACFRRRFEA